MKSNHPHELEINHSKFFCSTLASLEACGYFKLYITSQQVPHLSEAILEPHNTSETMDLSKS